jgi:hypothetical protein
MKTNGLEISKNEKAVKNSGLYRKVPPFQTKLERTPFRYKVNGFNLGLIRLSVKRGLISL